MIRNLLANTGSKKMWIKKVNHARTYPLLYSKIAISIKQKSYSTNTFLLYS